MAASLAPATDGDGHRQGSFEGSLSRANRVSRSQRELAPTRSCAGQKTTDIEGSGDRLGVTFVHSMFEPIGSPEAGAKNQGRIPQIPRLPVQNLCKPLIIQR